MMAEFLKDALLVRNIENVKTAESKAPARLQPEKRQTDFKTVLEQENITVSAAEKEEKTSIQHKRQKKNADDRSDTLPFPVDVLADKLELLQPQLKEQAEAWPALQLPQETEAQLQFRPQPVLQLLQKTEAQLQSRSPIPATPVLKNTMQQPDKQPDGEMVQEVTASAFGMTRADADRPAGRRQAGMEKVMPSYLVSAHTENSKDDTGAGKSETSQAGRPEVSAIRFTAADSDNTGSSQIRMEKPLETGGRMTADAEVGKPVPQGRIQAVDVVQNRMSGEVRILHLKLTPENLGMVEARLRMTENGLHVELRAAHESTARLLAADHSMLAVTLEKSGFKEHGRVSVTVADHSGNTVHNLSAMVSVGGDGLSGQGSGQGVRSDSQSFGQGGQEARPDSQSSGQNGREGRQPADETPQFSDRQSDDSNKKKHAYPNSRNLVV